MVSYLLLGWLIRGQHGGTSQTGSLLGRAGWGMATRGCCLSLHPGRGKSFDGLNIHVPAHICMETAQSLRGVGHPLLLLLFCSCQAPRAPGKTTGCDVASFPPPPPKKALTTTTHPFLRGKDVFLRDEEQSNPPAARKKSIIKASCSQERYLKIMQTCEQRCHRARGSSQASSQE